MGISQNKPRNARAACPSAEGHLLTNTLFSKAQFSQKWGEKTAPQKRTNLICTNHSLGISFLKCRCSLREQHWNMYITICETWPVQVPHMKQGTQSRCTRTTQRDEMGRRWEGCSGWGTHVHPWLTHVNIWQKPQYCKAISLQLK